MTLSKMPRKVALACLVEKASKMLEDSLDPRKHRTPTFNHRLLRYAKLRLKYNQEMGK